MAPLPNLNLQENSVKKVIGVKPRVNLNHVMSRQKRGCFSVSAVNQGGMSGGGVLDKPITLPNFDDKVEDKSKKPPIYRVLLHNDDINQREYVVRVLLKVIKQLTPDEAVNIMHEAHVSGISLVICCAVNDASRYCHGLRNNGLISSIEPSS